MREAKEDLRLYFLMLGICLKSLLQFRVDFLVGLVGIMVQNGVNLLAIGVILSRFHDLAGWTVWEIVFLYGFWMVGNSLFSLIFLHLSWLDETIIQGSFDRFLIRPMSPFIQLLGSEININGISDVIFGIACLVLALSNLHLVLSPVQWIFFVLALIASAFIELGITLSLSSAAFWTGRSQALVTSANQFNWNMVQQYPLEMFGRGFRVFVTCFIPVAFLNYYPARWLLGKITPQSPGYWLSFLSPLVALALMGIAAWIWKKGIRQYTGVGN